MPSNVLKCKRNRDFGAGETFGADNLMNPIWSFEMNVELKWSVVQSDGQTEWPVLLAQDGGDEEKYGYLKLNAPGGIGERIAGMFYIADSNGDPLADKGAEYPPTAAFVSMLRVSDDPSNPNYNLYYEERNRPVIITHKPTAELTGLPPNAIVLSDDIIGAVATYCDNTLSPVDCGTLGADQVDILTYAGAANPQGVIEESEVINLPYVVPIDDVRIVTTVGYKQADNSYIFNPDADSFYLQWDIGSEVLGDPQNLFYFQLVNSNPNIVYPEVAFVHWSGQVKRPNNSSLRDLEVHEIVSGQSFDGSGGNSLAYAAKIQTGNVSPARYTPGGGKREQNPPYELSIRAELDANYVDIDTDFFGSLARTLTENGKLVVSAIIKQDIEDVVVQEYWDHYPYTDPRYSPRRINCVQGQFADGNGECQKAGQFHEWPLNTDVVPPSYTSNYRSDGIGCGLSGCARAVSANYHDTDRGPFTLGDPFAYAESIRTQYIGDLQTTTPPILGVEEEVTPRVTSGWRNPELNERVSGVINSLHQWSKTLDLYPPLDVRFDDIYDPYDSGNGAANTWCTLAYSAYQEASAGGGVWELFIENRRGKLPLDLDWKYESWTPPTTVQSCAAKIGSKMAQCSIYPFEENGDADPNNDIDPFTRCSPDHVHVARKQ